MDYLNEFAEEETDKLSLIDIPVLVIIVIFVFAFYPIYKIVKAFKK